MLVSKMDKFTHLCKKLLGNGSFKHRNDVKLSLLGEICGDITQMLCHLNISFLTSSVFVCEFIVNKGSFTSA